MEKRIKFSLVAIVVVAVFFIGLGVLLEARIPKNIFCFLDIGTYRVPQESIEVNSIVQLRQTFISNFNNLFMLSIFIPTQNLNKEQELIFRLRQAGPGGSDLVTLKWKYNQISFKKNNFYIVPPDRESVKEGFHFHFRFLPIRNSKNKEFSFSLESPDAKPGEGLKVGFWSNRRYYEALTQSELFINQKAIKGFVAFRTYHTWQGNPVVILSQIKSRLLKDRQFIIAYGITLFVVLSVIITLSILLLIQNIRGRLG